MLKADGNNIYNIVIANTEYVLNFKNITGKATADGRVYSVVANGNADSTQVNLANNSGQLVATYGDVEHLDNGTNFEFSIINFDKVDKSDRDAMGLWAVEILAKKLPEGYLVSGWIPWKALQEMPNFKISGGGK